MSVAFAPAAWTRSMNGAGSPQKNEMTGAPAASATSTRSSWGSSDRSMMMFTPNGRSVIARTSSIAARISSGSSR